MSDRSAARPRTGVIWCSNPRKGHGWAFPPAVEKVIRAECRGTVLHLFGGRSKFGVRLDVDPIVRPDALGDAWMPPFGESSFGTVVLDPPYWRISQGHGSGLLRVAAMIAAERVIWLHTVWLGKQSYMHPEAAWLIRVGDLSYCRCLQVFRPLHGHKNLTWPRHFTRGPAVRYNKWLAGQAPLAFDDRQGREQ